MTYEYRQMVIHTKGWIEISLPDDYLAQLNQLARAGWEVDQMMPVHTGISGTSVVIILLKRAVESMN